MGSADERVRHGPELLLVRGREKDAGNPLYYNRARMYDPDNGRFTGKDPAGMVDGTNLYAYAGGNPVGRTDPSGRWFEGCVGWECRASPGSPPSGGSGGGGTSGGQAGSGMPDIRAFVPKCYVPWAMFLVGIGIAVVYPRN